MRDGRADAFWTAFFLTFCIFMTALALLTVDHRCRTTVMAADEITADFCYDSLADGDGQLTFQWFDLQAEITLRPGKKLQTLFKAIPALIPRPLRALALTEEFLPVKTSGTTKDGGMSPPSFYLSILEI